jgi:hypothetical protein
VFNAFERVGQLDDEPRDAAAECVRLADHVLGACGGDVAIDGDARHEMWPVRLPNRVMEMRGYESDTYVIIDPGTGRSLKLAGGGC